MESTISYGYPYASARIQTGTNCSENKSTPLLNTAEVLSALSEIESLASAANLEVLRRFTELRDVLGSLPDGFSVTLEQALQGLELEAASSLCSDMLAQLST